MGQTWYELVLVRSGIGHDNAIYYWSPIYYRSDVHVDLPCLRHDSGRVQKVDPVTGSMGSLSLKKVDQSTFTFHEVCTSPQRDSRTGRENASGYCPRDFVRCSFTLAIGAIGALLNRVRQPHTLLVLGGRYKTSRKVGTPKKRAKTSFEINRPLFLSS